MSTAMLLVRLTHVICAVLGGGLVAGIAIVAARSVADSVGLLILLTRWASAGLGATFLTGIALDALALGALHERWWFRIAGLSMIVCGGLVATIRRRVARAAAGHADPAALRPIPSFAWAACALVVWITMLMELQPF